MASNKKETIQIDVYERTAAKNLNRKARREKKIPAVIYGPHLKNLNVNLDELSVTRYGGHKFESTIFELKSDVSALNKVKVLIKSVQKNPATQRPVHVDLYALDMNKPVRVNIEIKLTGESIGVKSEGGVLSQPLRDLEVECRPDSIPDALTVDISELGLNHSLHVSDIQLPDGVKAITAGERTVASVTPPQSEEAAAPAAAAPAAAAPAAGKAAAGGKAPAAPAKAPAKK